MVWCQLAVVVPSVRRILPFWSALALMPSLLPPVAMNSSSKEGAAVAVVVVILLVLVVVAVGSDESDSLLSFFFLDFFSFLSLSFFFPVFVVFLMLELKAIKLEENASCHQFSVAATAIASTVVVDPRPWLSSRFFISMLLVIPVPSFPSPRELGGSFRHFIILQEMGFRNTFFFNVCAP